MPPPFFMRRGTYIQVLKGNKGETSNSHTFLDWGLVKDVDEEVKGGIFSLNEVRENMIILRKEV